MSVYITNTRPSLFQVVLNKLGIIELPIKVNCWYCNQNSFLLPGSKNTVKHWDCHLCENTNSRDDNGDIIDPSPIETNVERKPAPFVVRSPSIIKKNSENTICEQCQDNLNLIQNILRDYIPDESDPSYKFKCDHVDQYSAELHQRYKLCDNCRAKVNRLSEEQKENLRRLKVNTVLRDSLKTKVSVKPKKGRFQLKGGLWYLSHFSICAYVIYLITLIEYQPDPIIEFYYDLSHQWDWNDISTDSIIRILSSFYQYIKSSDTDLLKWAGSNLFLTMMCLNSLTYFSLFWHSIQQHSFFDPDETKNWGLYKLVDYFLFLIRFAVIIWTNFRKVNTWYLCIFLIGYIMVVYVSYNLVKVKTSFYPLLAVGRSFSTLSELPKPEVVPEANDLENFEDNMSIVSEPIQFVNDPLDNIVYGVDRIRF